MKWAHAMWEDKSHTAPSEKNNKRKNLKKKKNHCPL
jgi:hypothetical protein